MVELEETREQRRQEAVRRGLAKARELEQQQYELESMIDLAAARTMVRLQARGPAPGSRRFLADRARRAPWRPPATCEQSAGCAVLRDRG